MKVKYYWNHEFQYSTGHGTVSNAELYPHTDTDATEIWDCGKSYSSKFLFINSKRYTDVKAQK